MREAVGSSLGGLVAAFAVLCALSVAAACSAPASSFAADATSLGLDASHDGYTSEPANPKQPQKRWSRKLGAEVSVALIQDGRVFVGAYEKETDERFIYALDARTGETLWRRVGRSTFSLGDGRLFVATGGREIQAIDAASGDIVWSKSNGQYIARSAPVENNGVVYQGAAGFGDTLYARDASDGTLLWETRIPDSSAPPSVGNGGAYVSATCGGTVRVNLDDGSTPWNTIRGGAFSCSGGRISAYSDGEVFVQEEDSTPPEAILDSQTGEVGRSFRADVTPAVTPDMTVAPEDGTLIARDREEGSQLWRYAPGRDVVEVPAIVVGSRVATVSKPGRLAWLNVDSGEPLWSAEIKGKFGRNSESEDMIRGVSAGNGLLTASGGGVITAFGIGSVEPRGPGGPAPVTSQPAASPPGSGVTYRLNPAHDFTLESNSGLPGKLLWKKDLGEESGYSVLAKGRVFSMTRTEDSLVVRAHDRENGKVRWTYSLPYAQLPFDHDGSLAYADGRIFVSNQASDANDNRVVALDSRTGEVIWSNAEKAATPLAPVGDYLYFVGTGGGRALDTETGAVQWTQGLRGSQSTDATPSVSGDRIFFASSCRETDALNRFTGETIWERSFPGCSSGGSGALAPVRGGRLFADDGLTLSTENGATLGVRSFHSQWAITEKLTIERRPNSLIATYSDSGLVAWTFGQGKQINGGPLVVGDFVYVADIDGEMTVLRLRDGEVVRRMKLPGKPEYQSDEYRLASSFGADRQTLTVPLLGGKLAVYSLGR